MDRRTFIQSGIAGALSTTVPLKIGANAVTQPKPPEGAYQFPEGFLWGTVTAAHTAEGNNVNSDCWLIEHLENTPFLEPSLDTCDHYHLYPQDIALNAQLGFNAYRFSIEWARVEPEKGVELTDMGYEFWPEAIEGAVRHANRVANVPIIITENGVGTKNDKRRIEYINGALKGLVSCMKDGIDVRGYCHFALFDQFEWTNGNVPVFGLMANDLNTQQRMPRQSGYFLGNIARQNFMVAA
jgi:beta-glucosidase/6-phospho-beta-glucosidase/beta-galactosidase